MQLSSREPILGVHGTCMSPYIQVRDTRTTLPHILPSHWCLNFYDPFCN